MKLPDGERAVVDIAKLRDYCLSRTHTRGRHKARVFASRLGLSAVDAEFLRTELLRAAREGDAALGSKDEYGQRYIVDFELDNQGRRAVIRSTWIMRHGESTPRFTSCYVL